MSFVSGWIMSKDFCSIIYLKNTERERERKLMIFNFVFVGQTDAYQATGCYNLLCSGFVQTNNRIAIGAAISPISSYRGKQFDIGLMVWKVSSFLIHSFEFVEVKYWNFFFFFENQTLPLPN